MALDKKSYIAYNEHMARDNFTKSVIETVARRSAYICSNPDCKVMTLGPSENDDNFTYIGQVAHITAASSGGPRHDAAMQEKNRKSVDNALFLCSNCATQIDKNNGDNYTVATLRQWKEGHENWVRNNLNKAIHEQMTTIDGEHIARGLGKITAIKTTKATLFKPGTKSVAEGIGEIIATHIGPDHNQQ